MSTNLTVQNAAKRYLDERRRLGFDLCIAGRQLMQFARYADAQGHRGPLTLDLQLDWVRASRRASGPITWARRLELIRPFAMYYRQLEPHTAVPDSMTFGRPHRRLTPHIYTEREICDLLTEAGRLRPCAGLRPPTYQTLFGLIAATGIRLSEGLQLRDTDVDLRAGALTVRQTKFKKSRRLPLHPSTVNALSKYRCVRDRAVDRHPDLPFFVSRA